MKSLQKFLNLVATTLLASLLVCCDPPGPKPEGTNPATSSSPQEPTASHSMPTGGTNPGATLALPLRKGLIDNKGRSLEVTILAKSQGYLAVQRISDRINFSIPIADLSADSQAFLQTVAESTAAQIAAAKQTNAPSAPKPERVVKNIRKAHWNRDISLAFAESKREDLPIYLLFTGTSWCPPCKALESSIHNTEEFKEFANENLVLMKVDVPRSRTPRAKQQLIDEYGINSYPTVIVMDTDENILKQKSGFSSSGVAAYNEELARIIKP